jgi:fucose permease
LPDNKPEHHKEQLMKLKDYQVIILAYLSFATMAIPGAMLGPLWSPYMRESFNQEIGALGALLLSIPVGYFFGSGLSGNLFARYPIGPLLSATMFLGAAAYGGFALAPAWAVIVPLGLLVGLGSGILDGGMNIYLAAYYDARWINWLHACFGIGSLLGPQVVNILVVNGGADWRLAYVLVAGTYVFLGLAFFLTRALWQPVSHTGEAAESGNHTIPYRATLSLLPVWLGLVIFAAYSGTENMAGTWASAFFQDKGLSIETANNWTTAYWATFTFGRITFGFFVTRFKASTVIQACLVGALGGVALLGLTDGALSTFGLALLGFMLAPIFALMISSTQEKLGAHAPNAIGLQVAAAGVGFGALPALTGWLIENSGEEVLPAVLAGFILLMLGLYQVYYRLNLQAALSVNKDSTS